MKESELRLKAERSLAAARLLLENGFTDAASSRAYYAMFDAARAALIATKAPVAAEVARTHGGLIAAFARYIARPGLVPQDIARTLAQAQHRLIADYTGDAVSASDAAKAINWAAAFIEASASIR